jgi:hypothetical protein
MASFIGRRITASRMGGHAHRVSAIPVAGHALIGFLRRCPAKIRFRYFTSTRSIRLGSSAGARELFTVALNLPAGGAAADGLTGRRYCSDD